MVLVNGLPDCTTVLSPVVFGLFAATHVKVEVRLLVKGMLTAPPLQIVAVAELVIAGNGFTITLSVAVSVHTVLGLTINVKV